MTPTICTFLLALLVMATVSPCYGKRTSGGFSIGGKSELDLTLGGSVAGRPDGSSFNGGGDSVIGAKWKGSGFADTYIADNDHYESTRRKASGSVDGTLRPGFNGAIHYGDDETPSEFEPYLDINRQAHFTRSQETVTKRTDTANDFRTPPSTESENKA